MVSHESLSVLGEYNKPSRAYLIRARRRLACLSRFDRIEQVLAARVLSQP